MIEKLGIEENYKFYKNNYEKKVTLSEYRHIMNGLMRFIIAKIFAAFDVQLPFNMGIIGIRGKKIKPVITKDGKIRGIAPDWGATRKLWRENPEEEAKKTRIFCFNEHSNGIKYRIVWYKRGSVFKNKTVYGLAIAKGNRRAFAKLVKEGAEYLVVGEE